MEQLSKAPDQSSARAPSPGAGLLAVFGVTAALSAFLLFLVQPMFARLLLPILGGSPSVWTACMLFFQLALLAGYAYAHAAPAALGVRTHALLHGAIIWLPLLVLPIVIRPFAGDMRPSGVGWVLATSTLSVGLPFVVLATTAPLLQSWFATRTGEQSDPYVLYAASNAGSFAALLAYPVFIEPRLAVRDQASLWTIGYVLAVVGILSCAAVAARSAGARPDAQHRAMPEPLAAGRRLRWLALAMVPSSLLLGVTAFLSLDVAPVPLLWVVPLALYLASFVIVFSGARETAMALARRVLPFGLLLEVILLATRAALPLATQLAMHLFVFLTLVVLCHGMLAEDRPGSGRLTEYYLWLSLGGALGGVFNTVIAPRIFADLFEYPLAIVAACALLASWDETRRLMQTPRLWLRPATAGVIVGLGMWVRSVMHWPPPVVVPIMVVTAVICFSLSRQPARFALSIGLVLLAGALESNLVFGSILARSRTFFGVYRVVHDGDHGEFTTLYHGTTVHGRERTGEYPPEPLTYYHRDSPIADVFASRPAGAVRRVGVIGLGVGTLAAYAQPGEQWTFFEIDQEVVRLASDTRLFHYLSRCGAACSVVVGDGRLSLSAATDTFDVLALDAFSSDAIPVHLLTLEAGQEYVKHLAQGGVIALHISNRHLDLAPVAARLATQLGLVASARVDVRPLDDTGKTSSVWVALARDQAALSGLDSRPGWTPLAADRQRPWTDDFSSLWGVLQWRR